MIEILLARTAGIGRRRVDAVIELAGLVLVSGDQGASYAPAPATT